MALTIQHAGIAVILSSPSGAGKSSVAKELLKRDHNLKLSISLTTRPPRPNESEGINYYFKTLHEFEELIAQDELLEYTYIYGNYYGTPKHSIKKLFQKNTDILFDIDYQGVVSIKQTLQQVVTIFILPPNFNTLKQRIQNRGQDNNEVIETRMKLAITEIEYARYYDYIVINDNFEITVQTIHAIVIAERTNRIRLNLEDFLSRLKQDTQLCK